jgi:DNA-directed RNA polymerase specialized sigma24 family protein
MHAGDSTPSLTRLSTNWDLLFQAHQGQRDAVLEAQRLLMQRYCGAVYRYLLSKIRNPDIAEELSQDFAVRFLRGDFRRADPARGRFRDFVKTSLFHLLADFYRVKQAQPRHVELAGSVESPESPADELAEKHFLCEWRTQLLNCAWAGLAAQEAETGHPLHRVLMWRAEHPKATAHEFASQLSEERGKPFTEAGIRQILHRARVKFADLLVQEVTRTLPSGDEAAIHDELATLELLEYCRPALDRR